MTTDEIIKAVTDAKGVVKVSLSKDGTFLVIGSEQHRITDDQATGIWNWMHRQTWPRAAVSSSPSPAKAKP